MSMLGRLMGASTLLAAKAARVPFTRSFSLLSRPPPIAADRRLLGPVQAATPSPVSIWFREMCIFKKGDYNVAMGVKKQPTTAISHPLRVMDPRVRPAADACTPSVATQPHSWLLGASDQATGA